MRTWICVAGGRARFLKSVVKASGLPVTAAVFVFVLKAHADRTNRFDVVFGLGAVQVATTLAPFCRPVMLRLRTRRPWLVGRVVSATDAETNGFCSSKPSQFWSIPSAGTSVAAGLIA